MITTLVKQYSGLAAAGFAAAVCAGKAAALAAMGALGVGMFATQTVMFPVFVGLVALSLWLLYRSARGHGHQAPFYLALAGGIFATLGMWLNITGMSPLPGPWPLYLGGAVFLSGSLWDAFGPRRSETAAPIPAPSQQTPDTASPGRRAVNGAALAVAAAGVFYGLNQSVKTFAPSAEAGEIACWGVNACKGQTACRTAYNGCPGQNQCRGKGYLNVSPRECAVQGGVPLKGSDADPNTGTES